MRFDEGGLSKMQIDVIWPKLPDLMWGMEYARIQYNLTCNCSIRWCLLKYFDSALDEACLDLGKLFRAVVQVENQAELIGL